MADVRNEPSIFFGDFKLAVFVSLHELTATDEFIRQFLFQSRFIVQMRFGVSDVHVNFDLLSVKLNLPNIPLGSNLVYLRGKVKNSK